MVEDLPRRCEILDLTSSPTNTHTHLCGHVRAHTYLFHSGLQEWLSGWLDLTPRVLQGTVGSCPAGPTLLLYALEWLRELVNTDSSPGESACGGSNLNIYS